MQIKIKVQKQISQNAQKAAIQSNRFFKQLLCIKQWKKQSEKPETYILQKDGRVIAKGVAYLKVPYQELLNFCAFQNFEEMKQHDQMAKQYKVLYENKKQQTGIFSMSYLKYDLPFPLQNRDFITVGYREIIKLGRHQLFSWKSYQDKDFPQEKDVVRGQTNLIGYEIQQINENQIRLVCINDTDIKGNVPQLIKNISAKHIAKKVDDIEKIILGKKK